MAPFAVVPGDEVGLADGIDAGRGRERGEVVADLVTHLRHLLTGPGGPTTAKRR